jgi:epoxyqueuosine reductase
VQAGLGFVGRNATFIHPVLGSFVFIAVLALNDTVSNYDKPMPQTGCEDCTLCTIACTTGAITPQRMIDARLCISCITQYGKVGEQAKTHGYIWGCDICQRVCPHNKAAKPKPNTEWAQNERLVNMTAKDWEDISEAEFAILTQYSPLKRANLQSIKRFEAGCRIKV